MVTLVAAKEGAATSMRVAPDSHTIRAGKA
jgi:hypothetical protein